MYGVEKLSDVDHPVVKSKAAELTKGKANRSDQLRALFYFVRDEIKFGFPKKWDRVKASETMEFGIGYCNTKATLFTALCKAVGIPCRIHTALIDVRIMRGIIPSLAFLALPDKSSHSWTEVEIEGHWKPIDSYINDKALYDGALKKLLESGESSAFSISQSDGKSSCEFNFGEKGFVHMGAVTDDHGTWDDFSEYMETPQYQGMNRLQLIVYPLLSVRMNQNIKRLRN